MTSFRGSVAVGGRTVLPHVEGLLNFKPNDWHGTMLVPRGILNVGGPYRLTLHDGRSADFLVSKCPIESDEPMSLAEIEGAGPFS